VDRYEKPDGVGVTVEVFDMGNAEDAFGVFSYAREHEEAGIGSAFERKGSVLCFWQDRFYVCLAAEQRDPDPGEDLTEVAQGISQQLPAAGTPPDLLLALPSEGRVPFSDRYFHTHQSLNYHYYLARENVLGLEPETDVVLARYQPGATYLLAVRYPNQRDASAAIATFREFLSPGSGAVETIATTGRKYVSSGHRDRYLVLVLDAVSRTAADELRSAGLEALSRLPE
jgi:hypothetical protein